MRNPFVLTFLIAMLFGAPPVAGLAYAQPIQQQDDNALSRAPLVIDAG